MITQDKNIQKFISSTIEISSEPKEIWENITNVRIEQFADPFLFRVLGIPKPLKAELISEGKGGKRIAYFKFQFSNDQPGHENKLYSNLKQRTYLSEKVQHRP